MSNTNNIHKQVASEEYFWFFTNVTMEKLLLLLVILLGQFVSTICTWSRYIKEEEANKSTQIINHLRKHLFIVIHDQPTSYTFPLC